VRLGADAGGLSHQDQGGGRARHRALPGAGAPLAHGGRGRHAVHRGVAKVGVAFCVSLIREAQRLGEILADQGLVPELVCCRVGAIDYGEVDMPKANPGKFAAVCNPVAQARLLNESGVGLVAQVGLCIGHDLILQEECEAPVTTLVVKDRTLDHHPVRALRKATQGGAATG
jgi:uncharacterized metal-binding protein